MPTAAPRRLAPGSAGRGLAATARLLRNGPVTVSQALRQLRDDPVKATLLLGGLLPGPVKAPAHRLADGPAGGRSPVLRALSLLDRGRRAEALALIGEAGHDRRRSVQTRRRLAQLAVGADAAEAARDVLAGVPAADPARPRLEALVAAREGRLREAVATASHDGGAHGMLALRQRRTRRRLAGELAVLDPAWRPAPGPSERLDPVPGRVLHLVTNSLPHQGAGYSVRTHEIARAQRSAGLDPHVVTRLGYPVQQGAFAARRLDVVDGIPYHRLVPAGPLPWPEDVALQRNVQAAADLVRQLRPAVLHAASKHVNGQVALALRERFHLPVVYEVRGFLEETWLSRTGDSRVGTDRHRLARAVETRCMLEADHVVTLSRGMQAEIVERGVPAERISVVPNCVDELFLAPLPDAGPVRDRLGIRPGEVAVGLVSSLAAYEGVDVLVRAVARLVEAGAPVRLLVVGDGAAAPSLRALAAELGLGSRAVFTGRVPFRAVREYHAALDVFCVPRLDVRVTRLVTPLKPLEAMASGRPVVASDLPALAEIVEADVTGVLVRAGDDGALAAAVGRLVADPAERRELGGRARRWVADHRTWAGVIPRYLQAYRQVGADV